MEAKVEVKLRPDPATEVIMHGDTNWDIAKAQLMFCLPGLGLDDKV